MAQSGGILAFAFTSGSSQIEARGPRMPSTNALAAMGLLVAHWMKKYAGPCRLLWALTPTALVLMVEKRPAGPAGDATYPTFPTIRDFSRSSNCEPNPMASRYIAPRSCMNAEQHSYKL